MARYFYAVLYIRKDPKLFAGSGSESGSVNCRLWIRIWIPNRRCTLSKIQFSSRRGGVRTIPSPLPLAPLTATPATTTNGQPPTTAAIQQHSCVPHPSDLVIHKCILAVCPHCKPALFPFCALPKQYATKKSHLPIHCCYLKW
jgi:hypothetical protein